VSELGQLLRNARIERKISLDDLQEATKIRKRYLEAIEEGNYKVLPGSFYVRAFIKSYAEMVGLDPNEVLKLYETDMPPAEAEPVAKPPKRARASSRNADRISSWVSNLVMISFILLILGALYFYFYNNAKTPGKGDKTGTDLNNRITNSTPPPAGAPHTGDGGTATDSVYGKSAEPPVQTPAAAAPAALAPVPPANAEVKFVRSDEERNIDYYTVTGAAKLELQLKVTNSDCWYQLDSIVNGKRKMIKQEQKSSGYSNSWSLDTSAFLRVGKANAVEITVNGTVIPAGDSPNPKNIEIDLQPS
jgi:cytoskeletal protein RodZ